MMTGLSGAMRCASGWGPLGPERHRRAGRHGGAGAIPAQVARAEFHAMSQCAGVVIDQENIHGLPVDSLSLLPLSRSDDINLVSVCIETTQRDCPDRANLSASRRLVWPLFLEKKLVSSPAEKEGVIRSAILVRADRRC